MRMEKNEICVHGIVIIKSGSQLGVQMLSTKKKLFKQSEVFPRICVKKII